MIFIANYWTDPSDTTVIVYSNCEKVELRLNDRLITTGRRQNDSDSTNLLRPPFIFNIDQFEPGRLEAIGLNKGKSVVRTTRSTPGKKHHQLRLEIDESEHLLSNNDVVFIYAFILDENENLIPDATDSIEFSLDTSKSDDDVSFIGKNPVEAEAGIATILLKTHLTFSADQIKIFATSKTVEISESQLVIETQRKKIFSL